MTDVQDPQIELRPRITEQADISKGVITYHFSGKDEILREVVTRFFEQGWEYMEPRIRAERTATGQVRAWVRSELEFFGGRRTDFIDHERHRVQPSG